MSENEEWLASNLLHTITVIPGKQSGEGDAIPNIFGEVEQGNAPNRGIRCLITSSKRRYFTQDTRASVRSYQVVLGLESPVEIDWEVRDGYDQFGNQIIKSGKIDRIDPILHLTEGIIGWQLNVSEA